MSFLTKKFVLITLVTLGAAGALAWPKIATASKAADTKAVPAASGASAPLRVKTFTVGTRSFQERINVTGSLRAEEGVDLQVEVSGKIVTINFVEGTAVKKGDLLLKINDSELQAQLNRAIYRRQIAELKETRLRSLLKSGGVPQQDYDASLNELNVQRSEVELINAQVAKTEIRAPFDGVIGLRFVSEGAFITATSQAPIRIATLQAMAKIKVDFSLPERYAHRVKVGTPITFTLNGSDQVHHGEIYAIEPRIDLTTRTLQLRALCPNPDNQLIPGAFANVECPLSSISDAILIPSIAVVPGLSEKNVYVVKDGKAIRKPVELGTRTESEVLILKGLAPGEQLITSAIQQMRNGLPVQAMETTAKPADSKS